jgi:PAS domain S-box-containing protein
MSKTRPTYRQLQERLALAEPVLEALRHHEVDAIVGEGKIAVLLLRGVEEELHKCGEEFHALFNLDGVGMIQAQSPDFRLTRVNPRFCEITGYSAAELLSKKYVELTHPDDRREGMKLLARMLRGKIDHWSIEKRQVRKDGGVRWVRVHGAAVRDEAGVAVRIVAMVTDITAHKQAQRTIARTLHDYLQEPRAGAKRPTAASQRAQRTAVRRALMKIQNLIQQSIAPPRKPAARGRNAARRK